MDNPINWSLGVGSLFGIRIKLHLFFIVGAAYLVFTSVSGAAEGARLSAAGYGLGTAAILFLVVLLHEFGHCWGARRVGGEASEILLWPLGGLASVSTPHSPRANLIMVVAGPMVNVIICAVISVTLVLMSGSIWAVPWNPFGSGPTVASEVQLWLVILFRISYVLLLFNLAPVFPLDGGRVLQCMLWPSRGYVEATKIATGVGMVGAIAFALLGLATGQTLLLFIAMFGYLTCYQQRQQIKAGIFSDENEFGYDFSQGYTSLERGETKEHKPGFFERRRIERARLKEAEELLELEEHHVHVDAILRKISASGTESLTTEEQRILDRESQRQKTGSEPQP